MESTSKMRQNIKHDSLKKLKICDKISKKKSNISIAGQASQNLLKARLYICRASFRPFRGVEESNVKKIFKNWGHSGNMRDRRSHPPAKMKFLKDG